MGRPLNKKYFGNRNIGTNGGYTADDGIGGEGVASVTIAANNSDGYTTGSAATLSAPTIAGGVTATSTITTFAAAGAMTDKTTFTRSGTSVAATGTYTSVAQKAGGTTIGTGARFTITKSTSATSYAAVTITVTSPGSGYALADTILIDGALLGGVTSTNDLTLTVATFVGTTGTVSGFVITNKGSGYTTAPTVTAIANPGTQGTTTFTPVLTTDSGNVGTTTNQENAIVAYAYIGGALREVDIVKQVSTDRYRVNSASTGHTLATSVVAKLQVTLADGSYPTDWTVGREGYEMNIVATDSTNGTYFVKKLTAHKAVLVPAAVARLSSSAGTQFAPVTPGVYLSVPWNFTLAVVNKSVVIENA